jgi:hypothetical protein
MTAAFLKIADQEISHRLYGQEIVGRHGNQQNNFCRFRLIAHQQYETYQHAQENKRMGQKKRLYQFH